MSEGTEKALVKTGQVKRIGGWHLSVAEKVKIRRVMAEGTPENTKRAYRGDVAAFWAWAATQGASEAYPAPFGLVLKYILHHLDQHAPATLERRISGLSVAHQLQGVPSELNPCRHSQVRVPC